MNPRVLLIPFLAVCMGFTSCQTTDTIVLPTGPKAAALMSAKDDQIKGLLAQVKDEQAARELADKQASLAAANLDGILFAAQHVDAGLPRNAIEEEAKLGKARLPAPDAAEVLKSKDRVIAILENEVEKAKALYGAAFDEAAQAKAQIAAKDKDIATRNETIKNREARIAVLTDEAEVERAAHVKDVQDALAKKDAEIAKVKSDAASKERATWVLWARIISLGLVVIGAVIAIVFKIIPEGAALGSVGLLIGLVSMFVDWLVNQWFFPWMMGLGILAILIAGGVALYRMWKAHTLSTKVTAAIQDIKDESTTLGNDLYQKVEEHLDYRLGDKGKAALEKTAAKLGLTNPIADAATKENAPTE